MSTATRHKYGKHFLKQVIARVDFAASAEIGPGGPSSDVIDALKRNFPIPERRVVKTNLNVRTNVEPIIQHTTESITWEYRSVDRDKRIVIDDGAMFVEYEKYESYEHLTTDFIPALEAFLRQKPGLQVSRLGLRYIDNIQIPNLQKDGWEDYLDDRLVAVLKTVDEPDQLARALTVIQYNFGEWSMRFQFGLPNEDFPASIRKWTFVLDTDAYCQMLIDASDIRRLLDAFHVKINEQFEGAITDKLRSLMEPISG